MFMNKPKNKYKINWMPVLITLAGLTVFSFILFLTLAQVSRAEKPHNKKVPEVTSSETAGPAGEAPAYDSEILAVVKELDTENRRITLLNTGNKEIMDLFYSGGTDVTDKFGQVISMSQIPIGAMVDIYYSGDEHKISKLQLSTKAWEYLGVNNLEIQPADRIMKIGQTKYKYYDEIIVLNDGSFVGVNNIAEQDELNVWGYDQTIWSVTVAKGHGTVTLTDEGAFLGGSVTVGYEAMQQITEDLKLTVREGNFNLSVENGKYSGTMNITVLRNQEIEVSLKGLGPEPVKHGRVTFDINPFGADLFIDGELTNYGSPIELAYGNHEITVSLGGYITYDGTLRLDVAGKKIKISLPKVQSTEAAEIVEAVDEPDKTPVETKPDIVYNEWNHPGEEDGFEEDPEEERSEEDYILDEGHKIYVQYPQGASVYLNGDYMGMSPGSFQKVIGSQVLTFIREGYVTQSYTIDVLDDGMDMYLSLPELIPVSR